MQRKKKVLVTGGAGFIGSHLCEELLKRGNSVVCLDNFFTGSRANVEHLLVNPDFRIVEHDVTEPFDADVREIYNLACPASPVHYQHDPIKTIKTSTVGMVNMLELALRRRARILQASTSEIYGDPLVHPQTEAYWGNVNPIGIRSCYDEGKRVAETLSMDYHRERGVEVRIARIFNTYGPRMQKDDGRVVSNFIVQALLAKPLSLYGDGRQTRSFAYVSDTVDGLIKMMEQDESGPVNIGNPAENTVRELAEKIIALTGSRSEILRKPLPKDDPRRRRPDISRAWKLLRWQPVVPLEEGLTKTIAYFRAIV